MRLRPLRLRTVLVVGQAVVLAWVAVMLVGASLRDERVMWGGLLALLASFSLLYFWPQVGDREHEPQASTEAEP